MIIAVAFAKAKCVPRCATVVTFALIYRNRVSVEFRAHRVVLALKNTNTSAHPNVHVKATQHNVLMLI